VHPSAFGGQPAAGSGTSLRQQNSQAVLTTLYRYGQCREVAPALRVTEIMSNTGLSRPTVETVAEGLTAQGWLALVEPAGGGGRLGRPAKTYKFHAGAGHVVGVDVGAEEVAVCVADLLGVQVAVVREAVAPDVSATRRFAVLERALRSCLTTAGLTPKDPLAVTVGTPGILDPARQRILTSPGLSGWTDFDLRGSLEELVACEVELENDANLAAVAERVVHRGGGGSGQGEPGDLIFLLLGERLGAGVIVNGQLVRGHNGASGELWHVRSGVSKPRSEDVHSLGSIVNAPNLVAAADTGQQRDLRSSSARAVGRGERGGGSLAEVRSVDEMARELARGISPVLLALDTEIVVLGGHLGDAGPALAEALVGELRDLVLYPPRVVLSTLGINAILDGAVRQGRTKVEREVLARVVA
jgi:predicted NBD/HSP70 family sugar kinase